MNCNSNSPSLSYQRFGLFAIGQALHSTMGTVHLLFDRACAVSLHTAKSRENPGDHQHTVLPARFTDNQHIALPTKRDLKPSLTTLYAMFPVRLMTRVPHGTPLPIIRAKASSVGQLSLWCVECAVSASECPPPTRHGPPHTGARVWCRI